jgi:hypothetical protein
VTRCRFGLRGPGVTRGGVEPKEKALPAREGVEVLIGVSELDAGIEFTSRGVPALQPPVLTSDAASDSDFMLCVRVSMTLKSSELIDWPSLPFRNAARAADDAVVTLPLDVLLVRVLAIEADGRMEDAQVEGIG